jgi:hypothetical protein
MIDSGIGVVIFNLGAVSADAASRPVNITIAVAQKNRVARLVAAKQLVNLWHFMALILLSSFSLIKVE